MIHKFEFDVTQEDIDNGLRTGPCTCAVALAIKRRFPTWDLIMVSQVAITFFGHGVMVKALVEGSRLSEFVMQFDEDKASCIPERLVLEVGEYVPNGAKLVETSL